MKRARRSPARPGRTKVVGLLEAVSPLEQLHIWMVRRWLDDPENQQEVWNLLAGAYGGARAKTQLRTFETYLSEWELSAQRPLFHGQVGCPCLGRDEKRLADVMRYATVGDQASAANVARELVRPQAVSAIVRQAAEQGRSLSPEAPALLCRTRLIDHTQMVRKAIAEAPSRLH